LDWEGSQGDPSRWGSDGWENGCLSRVPSGRWATTVFFPSLSVTFSPLITYFITIYGYQLLKVHDITSRSTYLFLFSTFSYEKIGKRKKTVVVHFPDDTAVLGAEIYESIGELREDLREDQKKRALDGWDQMDTKRQLEDSLRDAQGEIADLKAQVNTLEFLVEKLTCLTPDVPKEATFRVASPPLPDIGFPPLMEIPGLTINQTTIDEFLDWSSFDRSWPHGGYEADVEKDGDGDSNKENEWVAVLVDE